MTAFLYRERIGDHMLTVCTACGAQERQPDKGLGRAYLAAWESRHGENCHRADAPGGTS